MLRLLHLLSFLQAVRCHIVKSFLVMLMVLSYALLLILPYLINQLSLLALSSKLITACFRLSDRLLRQVRQSLLVPDNEEVRSGLELLLLLLLLRLLNGITLTVDGHHSERLRPWLH